MGKKSMPFPKEQDNMAKRKKEKKQMKSVQSPYQPFDGFYPVEEVIDTYMEIWYRDDSDSSSS